MKDILRKLVNRELFGSLERSFFLYLALSVVMAGSTATVIVLPAIIHHASIQESADAGRSSIDLHAGAGETVPPALVPSISKLSGVTALQPLVEKEDVALPVNGTVRQSSIVDLVVDEDGSAGLRKIEVVEGRLPHPGSTTAVAIDKGLRSVLSSASNRPVGLGSSIELLTNTTYRSFTVVGITDGTSAGPSFTESSVFITPSEEPLFSHGMRTPLLAIRVAGSTTAFIPRLLPLLKHEPLSVEPTNAGLPATSTVVSILTALGILAVLEALAFIAIMTTLRIADHRRELALLRLAGAPPRFTRSVYMRSAAAVTVPSIITGGLVGTLLGEWIAISSFGPVPPPASTPTALPSLLLIALATGVVVAVATWFAHRSFRSRDLAGELLLRRSAIKRQHTAAYVAGFILSAFASVMFWLWGSTPGLLATAAAAAIAAYCAIPLVLPAAQSVAGRVATRFVWYGEIAARTPGAHRGISRFLASSLVLGIATMMTIVLITASTEEVAGTWIHGLFAGNVVFASSVTQNSDVAAVLSATPGVSSVRPIRIFSTDIDNEITPVAAITPEDYLSTPAPDVIGKDRNAALALLDETGTALIPSSLASSNGWHLGTKLAVSSLHGEKTVTVVGIVAHSYPSLDGSECVIMGSQSALTLFGSEASGFNDLDISSTLPQQDLSTLALTYGLAAIPVSQLTTAAREGIDQTLGPVNPLAYTLGIVALLAFVAVFATTARRNARTVNLLRVIGMSRSHIVGFLTIEALTYSLVGLIVGTALATAELFPLLRLLGSPSFLLPLEFSLPFALAMVLGAILLPLASVLVPAYTLSRERLIRG